MPRQPTATEIRLKNLADCLTPTLRVLNELNDAYAPPFIQPISNTVSSLLKCVQNVKKNKKECAKLLENIYQVIYALINLHIESEVAGTLSPGMTERVGEFMKTLHKIFTYVQAQEDGNKIKQLFHYIEAKNLLKDCYAELDEAFKVFEVGLLVFPCHKPEQTIEWVHLGANELKNSLNSLSLLPSTPKIFHGRETELGDIIQMLAQPSPTVAILGGGGIGKTSLARAALHHQTTLTRFEERFFISAEPAITSVELAALIGLHVGLNPGKDLTNAVVQYFSRKPSSLLILDNLETVWEPIHSRAGVEEFLSLLADVEHLGLIKYTDGRLRPVIDQISANLGNIQEVLQRGLDVDHSELTDTVGCGILLISFYRLTGQGTAPIISQIQHILPKIPDHRIHIQFITEVLRSAVIIHVVSKEQMIPEGISHFEHIIDPLLESQFYTAAAFYTTSKSDLQHALQLISKAQELSQLSGDITQEYRVLLCIARLKAQSGQYSIAQKYASEAQQLSELSADLYNSADALFIQAQCSAFLGNYRKSMVQLNQARNIVEICGMSEGLLDCGIILQQAEIHLLKSEYTEARRIFSDIAETTFQAQQLLHYAQASLNTAYIDIQIGGATADIWNRLSALEEIRSQIKGSYLESIAQIVEACIHLRERTFQLARLTFQEYLHSPITEFRSLCLEHLANTNAWPATIEQSSRPVIYLSFAYKLKEKLALHKALLFLGDVFIASKDESTAFSLYTVALEGFKHMDVHQKHAECMLRLGDFAHTHGNTVAAIIHWKTAHPLFERSSQAREVAQIDSKFAAIEKACEKALSTLANLEAPDQQLHMFSSSKEKPVNTILV
ncbi:hypothetical protein C8R45DRAFT_934372 [Mycena sanguinolenta]|nr:hypothetical protein C8R45DRAFT_934372 [Mycena sanguinolenta]